MGKIIDFDVYPVRITLPILLQDKTTKQNIIWDTDAYDEKKWFSGQGAYKYYDCSRAFFIYNKFI